ncbi:MAG: hypothetical protein WCN99_05050 [bacterium]
MRRFIQLPTHIGPPAIVAVGDPTWDRPAVDRCQEELVHQNRW